MCISSKSSLRGLVPVGPVFANVQGSWRLRYINVWTTDNELGDEVIRVRRGDAEAPGEGG